MKLLHVLPAYWPAVRYGGPVFAVHGFCRELAARGHDVEVMTTNVDGPGDSDVPLQRPAWRDGVKPTIGGVMERVTWSISEHGGLGYEEARERLALVNLGIRKPEPPSGWLLAVPKDGPHLKRLFAGEIWHDGVWFDALKQAPETIVRRNGQQKVRINGIVRHCLLIDMKAFGEYADSVA